MRINNNISALTTQNALSRVSGRADSSMKKLSTGLRINSAADDAAGMAISNKIKTQVNGLRMASRNSLDGISLVQTAEGALNEVQSMVQRMRELAVQAANDTLQAEDRAAIQREVDQLITEINDTAMKTEFNKIRLLNGDSDRATASSNSSVSTTSFISDTMDPGEITYDLVSPGLPATVTSVGALDDGDQIGIIGYMEKDDAPSLAGSLTINGETIDILATDTPIDIVTKLRELADRVGVEIHVTPNEPVDPVDPPPAATWEDWLNGDAILLLATQAAGSNQTLNISSDNSDLLDALGLPNTSQDPPRGTDAQVENVVYNGVAVLASANGNEISITANAGQNIRINIHTQMDLTMPGGRLQLGDGTPTVDFMRLDFARDTDGRLNDFRATMEERLRDTLEDIFEKSWMADLTELKITEFIDNLRSDISDDEEHAINVAVQQKLDNETEDIEAMLELQFQEEFNRTLTNRELQNIRDYVIGNHDSELPPLIGIALENAIAARITQLRQDYVDERVPEALDAELQRREAQYINEAIDAELQAALEPPTDPDDLATAGDLYQDIEGSRSAYFTSRVNRAVDGVVGIVGEDVESALGAIRDSMQGIGEGMSIDILGFGPLVLHVGPNQETTLSIQLPALNARGLALEDVNMRSRQGADRAIAQMDEALSRVSEIRSRLGAYQNRLEYTIANLNTTQENATASLSRIEDVDMAEEMSRYTQLNVLSQAGVSILSQANMRPQQILSLLQ